MNYFELVSTVITVLTAIPAIVSWIKNSQSKLYLVVESEINLHKQITSNIDGFEIFYKKQNIDANARLLKCSLFYKGKEDVTSERITSPIELKFSDEVLIRDCKVLSCSEALKVHAKIENNVVLFETKLIKSEEFFQFEVFYEALDKGEYKLLHRISNVEKKTNKMNYFNITWIHEANIYVAMAGMMLGFFVISEMTRLIDENKALTLDKTKFKYEYTLNGNVFNQDSIYSVFSEVDHNYRDKANTIINTFSPISNEYNKLSAIKELSKNLTKFQGEVLKLSPFISNAVKADSIIRKRISEKNNFHLFFYSDGPYKLMSNCEISFGYRYSYLIYMYAGGAVMYMIGAFFLFRYFRISARNKFIIRQIESRNKKSSKLE